MFHVSGRKLLLRATLLAFAAAFVSGCSEPELPDLGPPADAPMNPAPPPPPPGT